MYSRDYFIIKINVTKVVGSGTDDMALAVPLFNQVLVKCQYTVIGNLSILLLYIN